MAKAKPHFLFAHGAGASSSSAWMQQWARYLEALGTVTTFDYPYAEKGRRTPDPLPKLIEAHRAALMRARAKRRGKIVLIGKSMGSRVGCHLALEEDVSGLICLGYPLKSAGKTGALRDQVLLKLQKPVLFVQGEKDPLCPLDALENVRARMQVKTTLFVVPSGNHSLQSTKTYLKNAGRTQPEIDQDILAAIAEFCDASL